MRLPRPLPLVLIVACRSAPQATPSADASSSSSASSAPAALLDASTSVPAPTGAPAQLGLPEEWAARPDTKTALVLADRRSDRVENGDVYEVARVELPERVHEILAPSGTRVVRAPAGSARTLFVATDKRLRFMGHPPTPITLEGARANMGCAFKVEGDTLKLGTFGEWNDDEGAASIRLVVRLPPGIRLGIMSELGGFESVAGHGERRALGHWYAPPAPSPSWERVTLELDSRHLAEAP